jgi:hypothetical protein
MEKHLMKKTIAWLIIGIFIGIGMWGVYAIGGLIALAIILGCFVIAAILSWAALTIMD